MLSASHAGRLITGGGRSWLRATLRVLLFSVLILLILLGVRDLSRPFVGGDRHAADSQNATAGYPRDAAAAFATRFALAYLTYDSAQPQDRQRALRQYLPDSADAFEGWDGQGRQSALLATPSAISIRNAHRSQVTVAVLVSGGRWIYLAVPVVADGGAFVIGGAPALVPPPARASWEQTADQTEQDTTLSAQLRPSLAAFFVAYAVGSNELSYHAAPGVQLIGMAGTVQFGDLSQLVVASGGGDQRSAVATVRWLDPVSGGGLTQRYRLGLVRTADRWLVAQVTPADGGAG